MNPVRSLYKINHFCCGVALYSLLALSENAHGSINDYIYPKSSYPSYSNYGTIGLIQMPNARLMPAGSLGISWSRLIHTIEVLLLPIHLVGSKLHINILT